LLAFYYNYSARLSAGGFGSVLMLIFLFAIFTAALVYAAYYYCENDSKPTLPICRTPVTLAVRDYINNNVKPLIAALTNGFHRTAD